MLKCFITFLGLGLIVCSNPITNKKNYYDDISKGTVKNLTTNENNVINAIIKYRDSTNTDEIVLISDSTINYGFDSSRLVSRDTFPDTLLKMLKKINDKSYYIGNSSLSITSDYRYFPRSYEGNMSAHGEFWNEFYNRFPKSKHGILYLSKIAINADSTMALAYVMWAYGMLGADGGVVSLKKENGFWKEIKYVIMIMS